MVQAAASGLTQEQIDQYWEDGFLVIDDVLTPEELEELRAASEDPTVTGNRSENKYLHETVHMLGLVGMHPAFMKLAFHPGIVSRIVGLLGPDVQLQHSKLATKPPTRGAGVFPWHQDIMFYPHTNTDLLSVMVMLDDATPENGCMQMIKGSHRLGYLDHTQDGLFASVCMERHYWQNKDDLVDIKPKAGGISIHHGLTLHGSGPNLSGNQRRGVVFSYRADDAYQLGGSIWNDTGLLIAGTRREQVRCDAGKVLLPKSQRRPEHPYGTAWNQDGDMVKRERDYFAAKAESK